MQTATQLSKEADKIQEMRYDQMDKIAAIIPYLHARKQVANDYFRYGRKEEYLEMIRHFNRQINTILNTDV